ncbi:MAG: hypothetical protein LIP01_03490 [Tannerellaceae bacterium]|nr:hypothetical protein [Tannerellaceae bacterium]
MRRIDGIYGSCLYILLSLAGCKTGEKEKPQDTSQPYAEVQVIEPQTDNAEEEDIPVSLPVRPRKENCRLLQNTSYRIFNEQDGENPERYIKADWVEWGKEAGDYYLGKTDFRIEDGVDDCSGLDTKWIRTAHEALLYINDPVLEPGKIELMEGYPQHIWPGEAFSFIFAGREYSLKGEGNVLESYPVLTDKGEDVFKVVENYTLSLYSEESCAKIFLSIPYFDDKFV